VGHEPELNSKGERRIWIEAAVADRLTAMRRRGEGYSDVILRLVEIEARGGAKDIRHINRCDW
jgi:predicted CopG family antitoxin